MRRLTAVIASFTLALGLSPNAGAAPADPFQQMSSQIGSSNNEGLKNAYRALPKEIRENPAIKQGAQDLGLTNPPQPAPPAPQENRAPRTPAPHRGCPNCVAITYDDGPAGHTSRLLDVLDAKHAHASFFLLAPKANSHPGLVHRMRQAGHTIGNHSVTHPELNKISAGRVAAEINDSTATIERVSGIHPRWFRPPYGATNGYVNTQIGNAGQAVTLWDVDTEDWRTRDTANTCRVAVEQSKPGSIVLMHDIHASSVDAAGCIIDGLRAKGLEPVSLDEMIPNPQAGRIYYRR